VANVKLSFTPDDDSPSDPILFLREAIRGGGNSSSQQRSEVPGILHGEKVKLVNATLLTGKFTNAIIIILITSIIGNHHLSLSLSSLFHLVELSSSSLPSSRSILIVVVFVVERYNYF